MKSYTGIEGYLKLTQIREVVNSEFFKAFCADFFKTIRLLPQGGVLSDGVGRVAQQLQSLTSNSTGQPIQITNALGNINKAIGMNQAKIKQAALKQKQWHNTWKYGIGLGFAVPILDALFLNGGELAIPFLVFSLVATTALAASIFYGCGKCMFKLREFDRRGHDLEGDVEGNFAEHFNVVRRMRIAPVTKLETYVHRFDANPVNSSLPLTMQATVIHALGLRAQGEAMGRGR